MTKAEEDDNSPGHGFGSEMEYTDLLQISATLRGRTVFVGGEVDNEEWRVIRELTVLAATTEPIRVILNSVGGEVYAGLSIYETIRSIADAGIPVEVVTRGLAASMGAIILQAASTGKRLASRNSRILIHEVSSVSWGKVSEQKEQIEELDRVNDLLKGILAERVGKSKSDIEGIWHKKDVWFSAQEAKDFGLVDEVL